MSRLLGGAALIAALAVAVPWLAAAGAGDTAFTDAERAAVRALAVPPGGSFRGFIVFRLYLHI